jgi:hypothetical protein
MVSIIETNTIVKWLIKGYDEYAFGEDRKLYNITTGRILNPAYPNGCIGYYLRGKFKSLTALRKLIYKETESDKPF